LLRGELGFTGLIVSDGLEMRAVADRYGIPEAAVQAVIAGTDLLCLGRDQDHLSFLAVRTALIDAVRSGRLPGSRLEEAAARVAELRAWTAAQATAAGLAGDADGADGAGIGLAAARRALAIDDGVSVPDHPLVVQLVPPSNLAVGAVPWGLRPWLADGSYREISTGTPAAELPAVADRLLAEAAGRSLVVVVRDAHRHPVAAQAVTRIVAARPDAVVLEMGLPIWRPTGGRYVASYGAAYSNSLAAAEVLGLTRR
jgi:beta-N-acetylhexosaminidase